MRLFGRTKDIADPQNGDVAQVRSKLATVDAGITQAEADLRAVSLQAALSEDPDAGYDAIARLSALRSRKELLLAGLEQAEQKEREAADAARQREWIARKRALSQQTGRLTREATEVSRALATLQEGIRRMEEAGQSIVALCPLSMRSARAPFHELFSPVIMRDLVRLERFRLGDTESKPKLLGNYMQVADPRTGIVKSMTDVLAEQIASVKAQFDARGLPAEQSPAAPLQTAAPETRGIVVDLRGVDLGVPKKQPAEATEESAEQFCEQVAKEVTADA
jgi:hypothetical protein